MPDITGQELCHIVGHNSDAQPDLLWVDVETTGLFQDDVILEIGVCISDWDGNINPKSVYSQAIRERTDHYNERLASMIDLVIDMHTKSGLLDVLDTHVCSDLRTTESEILYLISNELSIPKGTLFLAGSSVHYDGGMLQTYMPKLYDFLHRRQVNVSTLKELCKNFNPRVYSLLPENGRNEKLHRPLSDLADSITEYKYYVENFLWTAGTDDEQ